MLYIGCLIITNGQNIKKRMKQLRFLSYRGPCRWEGVGSGASYPPTQPNTHPPDSLLRNPQPGARPTPAPDPEAGHGDQ